MRLYEFDGTDPIVTKLIAVSDQLKSDLDSGELETDMSVEKLLNYFRKYDIVIDKMDLYNMIKKPPLKNLIDNIQGDKVIFKSMTPTTAAPDTDKQKTVQAMANSAAQNMSK